MAEKDITQIRGGEYAVSIVGIRQIMGDMVETHAGKSEEEVRDTMLAQLKKDNYIPAAAMEDYGKAFVREFRKFLGQPVADAPRMGLDIKVLGAGCNQCHALTQTIMGVLTERSLPAGVDHVTDIREIAGYGVMGSAALLINGKVVAVGSVPSREDQELAQRSQCG
jgi:hypothetical protein